MSGQQLPLGLHRPGKRASPLFISRPNSRPDLNKNRSAPPSRSGSASPKPSGDSPVSQLEEHNAPSGKLIGSSDYRLSSVSTKGASDIRHHIVRFNAPGNRAVNPKDDFVPPVKIQRRDPTYSRNNVESETGTPGEETDPGKGKSTLDLEKVAPHGGARFAKKNAFKKKTRQVFHKDEEEQKIRREEHLPWVIDDFEGKNTWVGNMEGGQTGSYMLFAFTDDGFKVIPADRFYKFTPRSSHQTLSIDEAEEKMNQRTPIPRWFMKQSSEDQGNPSSQDVKPKLRTVANAGRPKNTPRQNVGSDDEELDFNEDFADDEETPYIEGNEEDNRELEDRIKKEMLTANALGEAHDDVEEESRKREVTKEGKKLQRYLKDLEKNLAYESDDNSDNPYASESSETDSEAEAEKAVDQKKDESENALRAVGEQNGLDGQIHRNVEQINLSQKGEGQAHLDDVNPETVRKNEIGIVRRLRPSLVTLKLPKARLDTFRQSFPQAIPTAPAVAISPTKRRRGPDGDEPRKKAKSRSERPSAEDSEAGSPAESPGPADDSNLVTEDEVREVVQQKPLPITDLLRVFSHKFKKDKRNRGRIREVLLKVARMENGLLIPR